MLHLKVLGRIDLRGEEGRSALSVLQQPKRLALLTRLVLAGGEFLRRDELLALFWGDSDERRARRALNQAVHFLRRGLGPEVIAARGSESLAIAAGSITCDALEFEAALAAGDANGALVLYGGELLPGFFVDRAPAWQDWLDRERSRLAGVAAAAAWELSGSEEAAGNWVAAVQWGRQALACTPFDERSLRALMRLLTRAGDHTSALVEYERFADWTRDTFGDEPDRETAALAEELRAPAAQAASASTRTEAPASTMVAGTDSIAATQSSPAEATYPSGERGHDAPARMPPEPSAAAPEPQRSARHILAALAGLALLAALSTGLIIRAGRRAPRPAPDVVTIAVAPFQQFGDTGAAVAGLASALATTVAHRLARVSSFEVIPVSPHRGVAPGTPTDARPLALPGGGILLTGTVTSSGGRTCVRFALVDPRSGVITEADSAVGETREFLPVVDNLSRQIVSAVRMAIGRQRRLAGWAADPSHGRARRLLVQSDWQRQRATELQDAGSRAAARLALADADSLLAAAARQAPQWVEPWLARARTAEQLGWLELLAPRPDRKMQRAAWTRGIAFANAALARDARAAGAWEIRGVLRYMLRGTGVAESRPDTALLDSATADLERATALDRRLPRAWSILSAAWSTEGHLAEAAEAAEQALASDRYLENREEILARLYTTSLDLGRDSAAVRWCAELRGNDRGSRVAAACTLGIMAWSAVPLSAAPEDPWRVLASVREPSSRSGEVRPELEMLVAAVLARRGARDSALAVMKRADREAGSQPPPELLRLEALARATAGDREEARALAARYARSSPAGVRRLLLSRAFQRLDEGHRPLDSGGGPAWLRP